MTFINEVVCGFPKKNKEENKKRFHKSQFKYSNIFKDA